MSSSYRAANRTNREAYSAILARTWASPKWKEIADVIYGGCNFEIRLYINSTYVFHEQIIIVGLVLAPLLTGRQILARSYHVILTAERDLSFQRRCPVDGMT